MTDACIPSTLFINNNANIFLNICDSYYRVQWALGECMQVLCPMIFPLANDIRHCYAAVMCRIVTQCFRDRLDSIIASDSVYLFDDFF